MEWSPEKGHTKIGHQKGRRALLECFAAWSHWCGHVTPQQNACSQCMYKSVPIYSHFNNILKGILPTSASRHVKELFVPESRAEEAKKEAQTLPSVEINKVCSC